MTVQASSIIKWFLTSSRVMTGRPASSSLRLVAAVCNEDGVVIEVILQPIDEALVAIDEAIVSIDILENALIFKSLNCILELFTTDSTLGGIVKGGEVSWFSIVLVFPDFLVVA